MRPLAPSLCAVLLALLAAAPPRALPADQASAPVGAPASALPAAVAAPTAQFSRDVSLVVGQVSGLAPRELLSSLARSAAQPAASVRSDASAAVLAALWVPPQVSAALLRDLSAAPGPEAVQAAAVLSRLVGERQAEIAAHRAELALQVPELRSLSLPLSGEELFDGARARPSSELAAEGVLEGPGGHQAAALEPSRPSQGDKTPPAVDRPAPKQGFLARHRHLAAYSVVLGFSANAMKLITSLGRGLVGHAPAVLPGAAGLIAAPLLAPLPLFVLQMIVIVGAGKLLALLFRRLGQPAAVGYTIAGLALGPSLFGALAPLTSAALFPKASLHVIQLVSQVGLIAFMFCVGHELDLGALRKQSSAAGLISHASIFIPFVLGAALSLLLFSPFAPAGVPFLAFCLFSGIAMSITAFPVLASILHERGLTKTPLGGLALASAAIDDVSGWALLALVLAVASGGSALAVGHILGLSALYLTAMFGAVRPLLRRFAARFSGQRWYGPVSFALLAALAAVSSIATDHIGIHALFGAFLAGVVTPREHEGGLSEKAAGRVQRFAAAFLLPAFFALTGLRTHLGLLASPSLWLVSGAILAVAVIGKFGSSALAARFSGMSWRDSLSIGTMMNTRGLMELVVLNIAYDKGIISGPLFAAFVLMALITTMMTGPLLNLFSRKPAAVGQPVPAAAE